MSDAPVNNNRRRFLSISTSLVGAAGIGVMTVPFIESWQPSAKAKAAGAPVEVDISKLQPGQLIRVIWQGKPVWVVNRASEVLDQLDVTQDELRDPDSIEPQQPEYAQNQFRSIRPEIFVAVGICTHLGCSPTYLPDTFSEQVSGVSAGFFCPCHGSKFDMAGRVYKGVPAPLNLMVPPYTFLDENRLLIGASEEETA